jgi:BlaI family penicillinase repressor
MSPKANVTKSQCHQKPMSPKANTTVLTIMQNMEKKGLLSREPRGNAHVYQPAESRRQTLRPMLQGLLKNVFGGSVSTVLQHLLEDADVSDDELGEIRRLIDARRKSRKGPAK